MNFRVKLMHLKTSARFTADEKFTTFIARNAVSDVGGGASKIMPNNELNWI